MRTNVSRLGPRFTALARDLAPPVLRDYVWRRRIRELAPPEPELYKPVFSPWLGADFQSVYRRVAPYTLLSPQACFVLLQSLLQALAQPGSVYELGVYRGGSALLLHYAMADRDEGDRRALRLFDTFDGMPETDAERDRHAAGDFADTSEEAVRSLFPAASTLDLRKGLVPATFAGLEDDRICFAHLDLDIYQSVMEALDFVYPRLSPGGVLIFDDYGWPSCPGERQAVDEFFSARPEVPLALSTGQAIVHRLP